MFVNLNGHIITSVFLNGCYPHRSPFPRDHNYRDQIRNLYDQVDNGYGQY